MHHPLKPGGLETGRCDTRVVGQGQARELEGAPTPPHPSNYATDDTVAPKVVGAVNWLALEYWLLASWAARFCRVSASWFRACAASEAV